MLAAGAGAAGAATLRSSSEATRSSARLLGYERSGGLAGRTASLTVTVDRRVAARPGGRGFTLTRQEYSRLRADLKRANLAKPPTKSQIPTPDGYTYVITAGGHRVVTRTGGVPARLAPLLRRLNTLLRRAGII